MPECTSSSGTTDITLGELAASRTKKLRCIQSETLQNVTLKKEGLQFCAQVISLCGAIMRYISKMVT